MQKDTKTDGRTAVRRVPVPDQPKDRLYEMSMRFTAHAGIKALDGMLSQCFPGEGLPRLKDAVTLRLTQVTPFVPDDEALKRYAAVIQEQYNRAGDMVLDDVRFDGYDYLYLVEADGPENNKN